MTAAKLEAFRYGIAIDMPAGPSELLVLTDQDSNLSFVASDLLSQAEHGGDSQVICVVESISIANNLNDEIQNQLRFTS